MPRYTFYRDDDQAATSEQVAESLSQMEGVRVLASQPRLLLVEGGELVMTRASSHLPGWLVSCESVADHPRPPRPKVRQMPKRRK